MTRAEQLYIVQNQVEQEIKKRQISMGVQLKVYDMIMMRTSL